MRIAVVLTYPLYYGSSTLTAEQWLDQPDRERWLAEAMAQEGHQVEIWAVGTSAQPFPGSGKIEIPGTQCKTYFFAAHNTQEKARSHYSKALVAHAREFAAHLHILKGVDGRVGTFLLDRYLVPSHRPYAFIIGGGYYSSYVPAAEIVFYETRAQEQRLVSPGWHLRRKVPAENLIRLPKFIDTQVFRPDPDEPKEWDILVVGRLISRYKNYDVLGALSQRFRTAVCGDGPEAARLQTLYPKVNWLGHVSNHELPRYYNRAHLFMHTGFRDFYPRVLAEAMACGIPGIAFKKGITPEVLPPGCGLLVSHRDFAGPIAQLLEDHPRRMQMGHHARQHALEQMGPDACLKALKQMFLRLDSRPAFQKLS